MSFEIPKNAISDISNLQIFLDGNQANYTGKEISDFWLVSLAYPNSNHQIVMSTAPIAENSSLSVTLSRDWIVYLAVVAIVILSITVLLLVKRKAAFKSHKKGFFPCAVQFAIIQFSPVTTASLPRFPSAALNLSGTRKK